MVQSLSYVLLKSHLCLNNKCLLKQKQVIVSQASIYEYFPSQSVKCVKLPLFEKPAFSQNFRGAFGAARVFSGKRRCLFHFSCYRNVCVSKFSKKGVICISFIQRLKWCSKDSSYILNTVIRILRVTHLTLLHVKHIFTFYKFYKFCTFCACYTFYKFSAFYTVYIFYPFCTFYTFHTFLLFLLILRIKHI